MKIKTLRTGARCCLKLSRRSARQRDFHRNFEDAPNGSTIFIEILKALRTGARFFSFQDAPHGSAILIIRERSGADQFSIELV